MSTIALISCAKSKRKTASAAGALYTSPLFRKSLLYAISNSDAQFVLSAKHGLLNLSEVIEPYEQTLKSMPSTARAAWGKNVLKGLEAVLVKSDSILVLAGAEYQRPILDSLRSSGHNIVDPLGRLSLGQRLKRLRELNSEAELESAYREFYKLINKLFVVQRGGRLLKESTGRLQWPTRGIYFFLEPSEVSTDWPVGKMGFRVTRIGTHAVSKNSRTTLWNRLSTHRGAVQGSGSHRSSIFRLHVGAALASRNAKLAVDTWGIGSVAPADVRKSEEVLEREVTNYLGETRVLWLDVPDDAGPTSDRAYLERGSIGLLSRYCILHPTISDFWLGSYSRNQKIALSGLWNLNHLYIKPHTGFTDVLSVYVNASISGNSAPTHAVAPKEWYSLLRKSDSNQLSLMLDDPTELTKKRRRTD